MMNTPEKNKGHVSGDPFKQSAYFDAAEPDMRRHWDYYIWPRIKDFDKTVVLDLACGHGRNTAMLAAVSGKVIAADINSECIEACRKRFEGVANIDYLLLDGVSLAQIPDATVSLVYCWDAMVHFEPEVVEQYVTEFARVLSPGGHGLVHHSNYMNDATQDFRNNPHWRNYMARDIFRYFLRKNRLSVISQDIIGWDESALKKNLLGKVQPDPNYIADLDCISVFEKNR
jgi:ubiquinone/menaquinone biosynthesis C-methylase UbiE